MPVAPAGSRLLNDTVLAVVLIVVWYACHVVDFCALLECYCDYNIAASACAL